MTNIRKIRRLEGEIRREIGPKHIQVCPISFAICRPNGEVLKGENYKQAKKEYESEVQSELRLRISERAYNKYMKYLSKN